MFPKWFRSQTLGAFRRISPVRFLIAGAMLAACFAASAPALTIELDYDEDKTPSWDPDGQRLMALAHAAADIWEWHILDDTSIHFDISWDNLDDENRLAKYVPSYVPFDSIDLVFSTERNGVPVNWFMDETPLVNEEFGPIQSKLARELTPQHRDESFAGPVPGLLEVGVSAVAPFGSPADGNFDLLSAMLHEMGHALGMNFSLTDDDYDFDPADIGGLEVGAVEAEGYELVLSTALMNDSVATPGRRTFPSATDILATHDQNDYTHFNLRRIDYLGLHSDNWNDSLNWIGGAVPQWVSDVSVRNGGDVRIASGAFDTRTLLVDENSELAMAGSSHLKVIHQLRIGNAGNDTSAQVHVGALIGSPWLEAGSVLIDNGILNLAAQTSLLTSHGKLQVGQKGTLMGAGVVEVEGELNNDGEISAGTFLLLGFGGDLYLRALGSGKLDLDGGDDRVHAPAPFALAFPLPGLGNEFGRISAVNGNLHVVSPLADAFNGTATIGEGRRMHFYQPWTFSGELAMHGGTTATSAATLSGSEINFGGSTVVDGFATIDAPLVTGMFTSMFVKSGGQLNLVGPYLGPAANRIDYGGKMTLESGAALNVNLPGTTWRLKRTLTMGAGSRVMGDAIANVGRIQGSGQLIVPRVDNGGVIAPAGELRIEADGVFTQNMLGSLEFDLGGFSQGVNYDVLRVAGEAFLEGAAKIALVEAFLPAVGTRFDLLTAANVQGLFDTFMVAAPPNVEFAGQLHYLPGKVQFEVTQARLGADFDADGDVDNSDMSAWSEAFVMGTPGVNGAGDADRDFDVDGADMLIVQRQLGRRVSHLPTGGGGVRGGGVGGIGGGVFGLVPEPSSALLALGALAGVAGLGRRRR
jgi:hypothetical protein